VKVLRNADTDLQIDGIQNIRSELHDAFVVKEEGMWNRKASLRWEDKVQKGLEEDPNVPLCFGRCETSLTEPGMSTNHIQLPHGNLLHEEFLLERDSILDEKRSQATNLMIRHILFIG
jgi:hypothetical protein